MLRRPGRLPANSPAYLFFIGLHANVTAEAGVADYSSDNTGTVSGSYTMFKPSF